MKASLSTNMQQYYFTFTKAENEFIGYCNRNRIKIDWKNFSTFFNENDLGKLETRFYNSIALPYYSYEDMSGASWITNEKMYIYINATWNFYEDDEMAHGVEVIFKDENDEFSDKLPKRQHFKFAQPTNLLELANFKQFYFELIERLSENYLVD